MSDYKKQAKNIVKKMKSMGIEVSHAQSLEVIAAINGYNCWSAMKKSLENKKEQVVKNDLDQNEFPLTGLSEDLKKARNSAIEKYEAITKYKVSKFPILNSHIENWKITDQYGTIISANVKAGELPFLLNRYPAPEIIRTEVFSDDHVFDYVFSSELWFKKASDKEIVDLMKCGFGRDLPADMIAYFFEPINRKVETVLDYVREKKEVGFEVVVDTSDAMSWLRKHKPHLVTFDD